MSPEDVARAMVQARRLAVEWDLELGNALPGATCSVVFEAGPESVLKVPFPHAEEAGAWRTVQAFSGLGGVDLLRHDPPSGAMLMPRLRPGTTLHDSDISDLEAVNICASVILNLRSAPVVEGISLERWFRSLSKAPDSPIANEARKVLADLMLSPPTPVLLHGDLHHFNILRHYSDWVVIDPKGLVGDPSFEVVGFMRNPISSTPDAGGMRARLERFADRLGDPIERLWGWAFVETVNCCSSPAGFDWSEAVEAIWEARP
jgi:streptomycin 6-kinase